MTERTKRVIEPMSFSFNDYVSFLIMANNWLFDNYTRASVDDFVSFTRQSLIAADNDTYFSPEIRNALGSTFNDREMEVPNYRATASFLDLIATGCDEKYLPKFQKLREEISARADIQANL